MTEITALENLELIGYADVLGRDLWPAVVPPVFRETKSGKVLAPPFRTHGDHVYGGVWDTYERWLELVARNEMTELKSPLQARPDHELWIDLAGKVRYEPRHKARKALQELSSQYLSMAQEKLKTDDLSEAENLAQRAINANDHQVDALALSAAVCRAQRREDNFTLLRRLAAPFCDGDSFDQIVRRYLNMIPGKRSAGHVVPNRIRKGNTRIRSKQRKPVLTIPIVIPSGIVRK